MTVLELGELLNSGRFVPTAKLAIGIRSSLGIMTLGELDGLYLVGEQAKRLVLAVAERGLEVETPSLKVYIPDNAERVQS